MVFTSTLIPYANAVTWLAGEDKPHRNDLQLGTQFALVVCVGQHADVVVICEKIVVSLRYFGPCNPVPEAQRCCANENRVYENSDDGHIWPWILNTLSGPLRQGRR